MKTLFLPQVGDAVVVKTMDPKFRGSPFGGLPIVICGIVRAVNLGDRIFRMHDFPVPLHFGEIENGLDLEVALLQDIRNLSKGDHRFWDSVREKLPCRPAVERPMGPNKVASPACESGWREYCTCDECF